MTRIERIDAALKGEQVDKVPISFWRHFYLQERDAGLLADALLAFQREFSWDFMKVNERASYHVEDWGNRYSYSDDPHVSPTVASYVVHTREDWAKIGVLDIWKTEALKQQLVLLELVKEGLQEENIYFLQTIFNPLSIVQRLAGHSRERLIQAMENEPKELHAALEAVTETFANYVGACLNAGASGIFFATNKTASADMMTEEQYREFGVPYDLRVLAAAQGRPGFNMFHICGDHIFFDMLKDYPIDAISWDATGAGNPSLREGIRLSGKAAVGGISQRSTLPKGTPQQVAEEVSRAIAETGGRKLVLAPGCTYPPDTRREMLEAALEARDRG